MSEIFSQWEKVKSAERVKSLRGEIDRKRSVKEKTQLTPSFDLKEVPVC